MTNVSILRNIALQIYQYYYFSAFLVKFYICYTFTTEHLYFVKIKLFYFSKKLLGKDWQLTTIGLGKQSNFYFIMSSDTIFFNFTKLIKALPYTTSTICIIQLQLQHFRNNQQQCSAIKSSKNNKLQFHVSYLHVKMFIFYAS